MTTANAEQQDLFAPRRRTSKMYTEPKKLVRHTDPKTSIDAACALDAGSLEELVYNTIKSFGRDGCISDQVVDSLPHIRMNTITPRYAKLIEKGFVEEFGLPRKASSGRAQRVMRSIT